MGLSRHARDHPPLPVMKGTSRLKVLITGVALLLAMEWRSLLYYMTPPPDFSQGKVVLYATDWCPYCEKTRSLLEQRQIAYKEYNIETSAEGRDQYQRLAGKGVPVLLVAGKVIRGYNAQSISAALEQWRARQHSPEIQKQ